MTLHYFKRLLICVLMVSGTGCMSFSDRHFRPVRDSLSQQLPRMELHKEMALSVGPGMIRLVDVLGGNEVEIDNLRHVRVATYQVTPGNELPRFNDVVFEMALLATDADLVWERIVRVREEDEQIWIFAGMDLVNTRLEALSIFVLERNELTLISLAGDLNSLLQQAMSPAKGRRGVYRST